MLFNSVPLCLKSDLIYCWFVFPTGLLAVILGALFRKNVVLNAVGCDVAYIPTIDYGNPTVWYYRPFISWTLKNATKVMAISKESARWAEVWGARDVIVIYEGINVEKFKPPPATRLKEKDGFLILTVAPLEKTEIVRKDFESLFRALDEVVRSIHNVKLVVVGKKGDGYPILRRMVDDSKIGDSVVFTGYVTESELSKLYWKCDVFVLPSLHEGFPTVCAEAQACGKPVVSTCVSSIPEVIRDGETGLLVKPKDPECLAEAIKRLLLDPELRQQLGKRGRMRIENLFSKEVRGKKLQKTIGYAV